LAGATRSSDVRYMMRERILSWGDDFTIRNADGEDVFYVDGKVFSFGDKLIFKGPGGQEVARVDQKEQLIPNSAGRPCSWRR
jgi:uncharacterized protein YxjI